MSLIPNDTRDLVKFILLNKFSVIIVEGPRGSGKTTLCADLCRLHPFAFYKTWGSTQRDTRSKLTVDFGLSLPHGCFFALDCLQQILPEMKVPVVVERGNLSAMAYQPELYGKYPKLKNYYIDLLRSCNALLIYMTTSRETILSRRIERAADDEERVDRLDRDNAEDVITVDYFAYTAARDELVSEGLRSCYSIDLGSSSCTCYIPTHCTLPLEKKHALCSLR